MNDNLTAEEKISEVAKKLFYKQGYTKTTTHEIAEKAGVNMALLNYYYRSKEYLLDKIMLESIHNLISAVLENINDSSLDLSSKIDLLVNRYLDVLIENPYLPVFVLSELRDNSDKFLKKIKTPASVLRASHINSQIEKQIKEKKLPGSPLDYIVNLLSMTIVPIAVKDVLKLTYSQDDFMRHKKINKSKEYASARFVFAGRIRKPSTEYARKQI